MKALSVVVLLSLAGCSAHVDPYITSGTAGTQTGKLFLSAVELWKVAHKTGAVTDAQYEAWKVFGAKFQKLYPPTFEIWEEAVAKRNQSTADQMKAILEVLGAELRTFMTEVTMAQVPMPPPNPPPAQ